MVYLVNSLILAATLLTSCMAETTHTEVLETAANLKDLSVLTTLTAVNRALEVFGDTFQRAVNLYDENSKDLRALRNLPDTMCELRNRIDGATGTVKENSPEVKALLEETARLKIQLDNKTEELVTLKKAYGDLRFSTNENSLKLKEYLELITGLRDQLANKTIEISTRGKRLNGSIDLVDLLTDQLNIKNLVKSYDRSKDWRSLRSGLEAVLDHDSPAYAQLQKISWNERHAPWQIAYEGHDELVVVLVFAGRGINMTDGSEDNLLHGAVAGGQYSLVAMLLDNGADIETPNSWGNAPLHLACKYRHLDVARLLWKRGAKVDGINYDEKWAGLARAADQGYLEIVKFMVEEAGASTTIKDKDGRTPLEVAKRKGHTAVVDYLAKFPH